MKLLLDANLSWRLTKLLSPHFEDVYHVERCGLPIPANDIMIWNWAEANDATIVTNDEDYYYFSLQKGFPPKIILLKNRQSIYQEFKGSADPPPRSNPGTAQEHPAWPSGNRLIFENTDPPGRQLQRRPHPGYFTTPFPQRGRKHIFGCHRFGCPTNRHCSPPPKR